ncbi:MAG TPA: DNA polymerase I [Candidatus Copromorpha excrementigallinarum]|uniref:DNA polymerase I n=1 Tax=Candidatus Allocopromorpha excrementigallinarum TaxID=2840742 RepID=A0A9D1I1G1_9FIRM|nr:DNA polymerase I [Candidatus Copromorpha excrementigallinarum]
MKRLAVIDGNSLINRAYYAMQRPMITKEGIFTQGIYGFLNMMDKLRRDYEPEYMAVAFDLKAPTFRHKEYEEYKAGRKKMPPELAMEIPILKDILRAMNIKQMELEGFEADDIIGTVAREAEEAGFETYIFTGDKDELQLATEATKVIITRRGVSEFEIYDRQAMIDKYGFTPEQFIDFKGLMGDQSDNIPGIPGVGEKTASKLIKQFGTMENIIANVENITPKGLKAKVEENVQLALMSKRLATINTHVPVEIDFEELKLKEPDYERLIELYTKLEFNRFLKKLRTGGREDLAETEGKTSLPADLPELERILVNEDRQLENISLEGETVIKIFGDYSHLQTPSVEGAALVNGGKYFYFDCASLKGFFPWLEEQKTTYAGHGLKRDFYMMMYGGISDPEASFDTAVAQYVLDSGRSNYSLSALSNEYLHVTVEEEKDFMADNGQVDMFTDMTRAYMDYGFRICTAVMSLMEIQKNSVREEELENILYNIELPLVKVMASMEKEGFKADREELKRFGDILTEEIDRLTEEIHQMAGETFNINSPFQLGDILFEKLGLPAGKKTKRGYSTSADILERIREKHPIVPAILQYRMLAKLKSTYIDGLIPLINREDGKVHAHFHQTVTTTGRISCTEPNLQNIPVRQELGRKLRRAFIPENEKCVLVGADYSQIELRILAHMSADQGLIKAFNNGEDIHRATAANVLGVNEDEITLEQRSRAKAVNFGVIYGMSSFGLSSELHITRKDAEEYINTYFKKHAAVKEFMDSQVEFCRENGYVTTLMGRKRHIKEIKASQYMARQVGERLAMNTPIQGSAADIIKIAMIKVYEAIKEKGLKSKLILQVHDELIINTYEDEKEQVEELLVKNMEAAASLAVELKADLNEGKNWYELK